MPEKTLYEIAFEFGRGEAAEYHTFHVATSNGLGVAKGLATEAARSLFGGDAKMTRVSIELGVIWDY